MAEQYRALLIGNSHYRADPHNLQKLVGPVNDIHLLRAALEDDKVGMFSPAAVTLCANCTSAEIREELQAFFDRAERDEVLLLYYSGHGKLDVSDTLYLCTSDTRAQALPSTAVNSGEINTFIENSPAARTVIILDCCYSGTFKGGDLGKPLAGEGRYVLTSSRALQLANDASETNQASLYTESLVAGIRQATSRLAIDHLTIEELHTYVRDRMTAQGLQEPMLKTDGRSGLAIARRSPLAGPAVGHGLGAAGHADRFRDSDRRRRDLAGSRRSRDDGYPHTRPHTRSD